MFGRFVTISVLLCGVAAADADVIELKDKAVISAPVLAEKKDQVVIDLGYTVLSIPRQAIGRISKAEGTPQTTSKADTRAGRTGKPAASPSAADEDYPAEQSVLQLVKLLGEAVVQVRTPSGLGSGFFITAEGELITNFHVIEGETQIWVEVYHQRKGQLERKTYKRVRILATNKFQDLALLRIEDKESPSFNRLPLGDSEALSVGETVFAIGSPLGLERTVTEGIVSTKTRQLQGQLYLQTTAQINPGNSGGPLFNLRGQVVGVTNMKVFGEGIGFAIPAEAVRYFLQHRDAFAYDNESPNTPYHYLEPPNRLSHLPGTK